MVLARAAVPVVPSRRRWLMDEVRPASSEAAGQDKDVQQRSSESAAPLGGTMPNGDGSDGGNEGDGGVANSGGGAEASGGGRGGGDGHDHGSSGGGSDGVDSAETGGRSRSAWGVRFARYASQTGQRQEEIRSGKAAKTHLRSEVDAVFDTEELTQQQLRNLWLELPGQMSAQTAYILHSKGKLSPVFSPPLNEVEFRRIYKEERWQRQNQKRREVQKRRRTRRNFAIANVGYKEEEEVHEVVEPEFTDEWRLQSIVEDVWKAEFYTHVHRTAHENVPVRDKTLATRSDRLADVAAEAYRGHVIDQNRPVLTHELADFENPYMMKRSAWERLLQERCVKSELMERVLPRVLEKQPDLVKLRREAQMPPEVLEPLAAFRGDVRWHFDPRERLAQKLTSAEAALQAVVSASDTNPGHVRTVLAQLPENVPPRADQLPGVHHPWRNHLGFESAVPKGWAGGNMFGQPVSELQAQVEKVRYPTLQRVAHTLPKDDKWRAHVVQTIKVLERSKGWDYQNKLNAVNKLKEVYSGILPSKAYTKGLDEKMVVNRVPKRWRSKYAPNADYTKTYPKSFLGLKSWLPYRQTLTPRGPMNIGAKKSKLMKQFGAPDP